MCHEHCSNMRCGPFDDWTEGPCGENPGKLKAELNTIWDVVYKWRSAEVHLAAVQLGIREGDIDDAGQAVEETTRQLRIAIDRHQGVIK